MSELSQIRTGNVNSSEIVALTGIGNREMTPEEKVKDKQANPKSQKRTIECKSIPTKPFYTFVQECIMERFFKRSLERDVEVLAFAWGKLCEKIVHELLGLEYQFQSDVTERHPEIPEWVGTTDGLKEKEVLKKVMLDVITEIKCPLTLKSFYRLIRPMYDFDGIVATKKEKFDGIDVMNKIRFGYTDENGLEHDKHPDGEKFWWQCVSNSCIKGSKYAELIVFMPYFEDIETIKEYNRSLPESFWLVERAKDGELPYMDQECGVDRINIIRFEVPAEDKQFLESRVVKALELINK